MKTIKLIDITLRKFNNRETALTFKEKLEIARVLDRLKVDILELPPIREGKVDQLSNKTIASMVNVAVTASVRLDQDDIQETWESIRGAKKPRLNLVAPVSPVQMEYSCRKKAPAMLEAIREKVKECRFYCETVEFTAADATRAEMDFLCEALTAAIESGAGKITLCDTAGVMLPDELTAFLREIKERVPALADVQLYVQLSDELHVGTACAAAAIACGADGIKCTMLPSECPTAIDMVNLIQVKGDSLDVRTGMRTTELKRAADHLGKMLASKEETDSPLGNIAIGQISGVCLDANDDIGEVTKLVRQMGYDLSDEDNSKVYEAFLRVAKKKQFVGTRELDAIIASTALQMPTIYHIDSYVINCGNVITATANVLLDRQGEKLRGVGVGDGPIDAAFLAIEQIVGHKYELDDFQIQTVTEGRDAMGSALVKLRANGKVYSGSGISTDIIGASIRAYLSALNKILYEAS